MTQTTWTTALAKFGLNDPFEPRRTAPHMRRALRNAAPHLDAKAPPLEDVQALRIPGPAGEVPARFYVPAGSVAPAPTILFMHGGGYVIGDLDTHDRLCRRLAAKSGCRVLAIDYRLAPENAFPAATDDAQAAFDWLAGEGGKALGVDAGRLAVAGDSAGGGLAAMLGQTRRDRVQFQLLIYPLLQLVERRKPRLKALEGHLLSVVALDQIADAYLETDEAAHDRRVSPLLEDDLSGMPPTYIAAAELDPLLDEGQAYRDRLIAAGTPVEYRLGQALPHGYFNLTAVLPGAKEIVNAAAAAVGGALRD